MRKNSKKMCKRLGLTKREFLNFQNFQLLKAIKVTKSRINLMRFSHPMLEIQNFKSKNRIKLCF